MKSRVQGECGFKKAQKKASVNEQMPSKTVYFQLVYAFIYRSVIVNINYHSFF